MNKNLFSWLIYDTANSFITVAVGSLFLSQWLIIDKKIDDIWYGLTMVVSTILVLIVSPFLGTWSDKVKVRLPFLKWSTWALIIACGFLSFVFILPTSEKNIIFLVLLLALLIQFFYQISLIFYNAMLEKLSTPKTRGIISGWGEVWGVGGWLIGAALLLPFAQGQITLFGPAGRSQVFFPMFIFFTLLSLPMMFWYKETQTKIKSPKIKIKEIYHNTITGLKRLANKEKNIFFFLLSFCFVSDSILTIILYFAVIMDKLYQIPDSTKFILFALQLITDILSGYVLGKLSDSLGTKKILLFSCLLLALTFSIAFLSTSLPVLVMVALVSGFGWGGFYVSSRALLIRISPPENLGEYFGFYSTFQRFASIIGPLVWGIVTLALKSYGNLSYQVGGFSLIFLLLIGVYFLTLVKEKPFTPPKSLSPQI